MTFIPVNYTYDHNVKNIHDNFPYIYNNKTINNVLTPNNYHEFINNNSGEIYLYLQNIIFTPIIFTIILISWLILILISRKIKCGITEAIENGVNKEINCFLIKDIYALIIFTICCISSIICWFSAFTGSISITNGITTFSLAANNITDVFDEVLSLANDVDSFVKILKDEALIVNETCSFDNPFGIEFPVEILSNQLNQIDILFNTNGIKLFANLGSTYSTLGSQYIAQYISWINFIVWILITIMTIWITLFLLSTILRVIDSEFQKCTTFVTIFNKFEAFTIFYIGSLFLLILLIVTCLFGMVILLGSDFCIPNPDDNFTQIAGTILANNSSPCSAYQDNKANTNQLIDLSPSNNFTMNMVCYYTQCSGRNQLGDLLESVDLSALDIIDRVVNFTNTLEDLADQIVPFDLPDFVCDDNLLTFKNKMVAEGIYKQTIIL